MGRHPAFHAANPLTTPALPTPEQEAVGSFFRDTIPRMYEVMSSQMVPISESTRASMIKETNIFLQSLVKLHQKSWDGWVSEVFPLEESPALFVRLRTFELPPMIAEDNPEGVAPPVLMTQHEDFWFALRRFGIGVSAKVEGIDTPEGLRDWLLKKSALQSVFYRTQEQNALDSVDNHPSTYRRQIEAQGHKTFRSIPEAMTFETETFFAGVTARGLYKVVNFINQTILAADPDQPPFDVLVLPFGKRQMLAYAESETHLDQRGPKAPGHIEGGGKAWMSDALPGWKIFESELRVGVNLPDGLDHMTKTAILSGFSMIDGRTRVGYPDYSPLGELSSRIRDAQANKAVEFGYERALDGCHRFDPKTGYLDENAHEDAFNRFPRLESSVKPKMNLSNENVDPCGWNCEKHRRLHAVRHFGDVPIVFRSIFVDQSHGKSFSEVVRRKLGSSDVAAIEDLKNLVSKLERPPTDYHNSEAFVDYCTAVLAGQRVQGHLVAPVGDPAAWPYATTPWGFTTLMGIKALSEAHLSGGTGFKEDDLKRAHAGWKAMKKLWLIVKNIYSDVSVAKLVPEFMRGNSEDENAMIAVFANFFDERPRYPIAVGVGLGGAAGPVGPAAAPGLRAAPVISNIEILAAIGGDAGGEAVADVAEAVKDGYVTRDVMNSMKRTPDVIKTKLGELYKLVKAAKYFPEGPIGNFGEYHALVKVKFPGDEGKVKRLRMVSGLLDRAHTRIDRPRTNVTKETFADWARTEAPEIRGPEIDVTAASICGLSFHPSIWSPANARVRPMIPDRPLVARGIGGGEELARGRFSSSSSSRIRDRTGEEPRWTMDLGEKSLPQFEMDAYGKGQFLYPEVYSPSAGILVRGPGGCELRDFLARLEAVKTEESDEFAVLGRLCGLFSRVSKNALMACCRNGIQPPGFLTFALTHYAIRMDTQGIILARGGGVAGKSFWKHQSNLEGVDVISQEIKLNHWFWATTAIFGPKNIVSHHHFFPKGNLTGFDSSVVRRDFKLGNGALDRAMMVLYTGDEFTRDQAYTHANPWPLRGRFDQRYFGSMQFDDGVKENKLSTPNPPIPGWPYYAHRHDLHKNAPHTGWSMETAKAERDSFRFIPGIVFMEKHYGWNPATRMHDIPFSGAGHMKYWPDNVLDLVNGTHIIRENID